MTDIDWTFSLDWARDVEYLATPDSKPWPVVHHDLALSYVVIKDPHGYAVQIVNITPTTLSRFRNVKGAPRVRPKVKHSASYFINLYRSVVNMIKQHRVIIATFIDEYAQSAATILVQIRSNHLKDS